MELSKLQIVAISVLTTILTDKFLITHPQSTSPQIVNISPTSIPTIPTAIISQAPSATPAPSNSQNEIILRELVNLRKDMISALTDIKTQTNNDTPLPTLNPSLIGGMVKISSSQWKQVDVFEKPVSSSKIISSLVYDTIYFFRQKANGWYQLDLDGGQIGWVQSQFLKEFP